MFRLFRRAPSFAPHRYVWSPAVDRSDARILCALLPFNHS